MARPSERRSTHRAAAAPRTPEDSLATIHAAVDVGADSTECDPRPTKNSRMLLMHDADVDRTTNALDKTAADNPAPYADLYETAVDIVKTNRPRLLTQSLGR